MSKLCMLYGISSIKQDSWSCFQCGYFDGGKPINIYLFEAIKTLLKEIRPQAVNIVESLRVPDHFLQSAIGNSYGDIYETHLDWAKNSTMNVTKAGDAIPDGYIEYITPMLKAKLWRFIKLILNK